MADSAFYVANGPAGPDGAGFYTASGGVDKGVEAFGNSIGVRGHSDSGYGASFACGKPNTNEGLAQLRLEPSAVVGSGHPTIGNHQLGEFFVTQSGELWYFGKNGWKQLA